MISFRYVRFAINLIRQTSKDPVILSTNFNGVLLDTTIYRKVSYELVIFDQFTFWSRWVTSWDSKYKNSLTNSE